MKRPAPSRPTPWNGLAPATDVIRLGKDAEGGSGGCKF